MITATDTVHGKGTKTRNVSQFKPVPEPVPQDDKEPDQTDLDPSLPDVSDVILDPGPRRSSRTTKTPSKFKDFV